ncbi:MAG: nucleotidyltransferase family protein [Candidatus Omnitrophota bacterium]
MLTIILAAGYGTRLYPLTLNKPKALLGVGGKTILDRLVAEVVLIKACSKIVIVTNKKFDKNFQNWAQRASYSTDIEVIDDKTESNETRLGAIGDINLVLEKTKTTEDLLITGSDNLFDFRLTDFVNFGKEKRPFSSIALFDVQDKKLATRYGICSLDGEKRVVDFEEKPSLPKSTLAATALYFIPKEKITKIYDYMKTDLTKDAPGNLMKWLAREDKLYGYPVSQAWYDIGDISSLKKADKDFTGK